MVNLKKILVARDFSLCSDQSLDFALDLALRTGASVDTLYVEVPYSDPDLVPEDPDDAVGEVRNRLVKVSERPVDGAYENKPEEIQTTSVSLREIAAAPAILSYSQDNSVDLIVMGTHGRRGLKRMLLGSVAEEVVRLSEWPVLTIRYQEECEDQPAFSGDILVPVDFSPHSLVALQHAKEFAVLYGAGITLVHVVEDKTHPDFYMPGVRSIYDTLPDIEDQAIGHLMSFDEKAGGPDVHVSCKIKRGHPASEIISVSKEMDSRMIVLSTHGLTGLEHFFIGSVAEKIVRSSECPVLTIHTKAKSIVNKNDS